MLCSPQVLFGVFLTTLFLVSPCARAQSEPTHCTVDELTGPVLHVNYEKAQYRDVAGQWVIQEKRVWRRTTFDDRCFMERDERISSGSTQVYTFRDEGIPNSRRGHSESTPNPGAPPPPPPPARAGRPATDDYRSTVEFVPDSSIVRVLNANPETGRVWESSVRHVDNSGRVLSRARYFGTQPEWSEVYSYNESEPEVVVETTTYDNGVPAVRRKKYRYVQRDARGNWTERLLFGWREEDGQGFWKPLEVDYRAIEYRERDGGLEAD